MSAKKEKKVILIDGHSLAYRSYFAFIRSPLRNSKGQNTSAVFGFVNSLKKLFTKFSPKYMAVVFDSGRETFRNKLYQEYKSERPETPGDLVSQLPLIKEVISAYGLRTLAKEGFEADDILATIANRSVKQGMQVYIVTSDKDLFQLVNDNIFIYDVYKDIIYDREKTKEKFGIKEPALIRDILALAGDSIDNIPGVPGIGIKRAIDIMHKYDSFEAALAQDERLKEHKEIAQVSRLLATVKTDVKVQSSTKQLQIKNKDIPKLIRLFKELEFGSLLREYAGEVKSGVYQEPLFKDTKKLDIEIKSQKESDCFGFNFSSEGFFVCEDKDVVKISNKNEIKKLLISDKLKIGYDIKSQMHELDKAGILIKPPYFDTKIASWLLDSSRKRYEISDLILQHFQIIPTAVSEAEKAHFNLMLYQKLESEILTHGLNRVLSEIEMPLVRVLFDMEKRGVKIDTRLFEQMLTEIEKEQKSLKQSICQKAGVDFNINSPQQLSKVLFEKLELPKPKRTKTGYSTDATVLAELALKYPIVQDVLRNREITKLQTTYLKPMCELIKNETERIHCQFNQTGTSTGRLSSSEPNLQNIPIKGDLGKKIRQGFIAEKDNLLISADYSQIELRILAYISEDQRLKDAFLKGEDIHNRTAAAVFNKREDQITENERRTAKMVNYGLIYGLSDYGLAASLGIDQFEARRIIDGFLSIHYHVAEWREKTVEDTKQTGYAKTIFGRIRPFPGIFAQNRIIYESSVRAAINHPIQGSAADIIKIAMIKIDEELNRQGFEAGLIIQIHDELLLEIEQKKIKKAEAIVRNIMREKLLGEIPLEINIGIGKNWAIAHSEAK
ncbi:MAG: DNA polymerase I [Candidatus Latescibacteria bacterium]|nr:DNA polymerase I [Candidatus Latescibacterota bacterium]